MIFLRIYIISPAEFLSFGNNQLYIIICHSFSSLDIVNPPASILPKSFVVKKVYI